MVKGKTAVYTVLTGGYDTLHQPEAVSPDCDYFCFSNDIREKQLGVWQVRPFDYHHENPVRESRYPKLNPHLVLPDYEYSLYVDAKIALRQPLNDRMLELVRQDRPLAMLPHPERNCVYREAMILTAWRIGEPDLIYRQAKFLLEEHFPPDQGLYDCAVMLRKHHHPPVMKFSSIWWSLYCQYSSRDQMGVSYALSRAGLKPEIVMTPAEYLECQYPHKKPRRKIEDFSLSDHIRRYWALVRLKLLYRRYGIG